MVAQTPLAYQYAVIQWPWKLIYDERLGSYLLFDLSEAPGESSNLASREPATMNRLANVLHQWRVTQIQYYGDGTWHRREYPPLVGEPP